MLIIPTFASRCVTARCLCPDALRREPLQPGALQPPWCPAATPAAHMILSATGSRNAPKAEVIFICLRARQGGGLQSVIAERQLAGSRQEGSCRHACITCSAAPNSGHWAAAPERPPPSPPHPSRQKAVQPVSDRCQDKDRRSGDGCVVVHRVPEQHKHRHLHGGGCFGVRATQH